MNVDDLQPEAPARFSMFLHPRIAHGRPLSTEPVWRWEAGLFGETNPPLVARSRCVSFLGYSMRRKKDYGQQREPYD